MPNYIKITKTCAEWLIAYGKQLVDDGYGVDYIPNGPHLDSLEATTEGYLDQIPMEDGELWRYMNAVINFARTVTGILAKQMSELPPLDELRITEGEDF